MGKQSRSSNKTKSEFSGFAAFASHQSSAAAAITRHVTNQQQQVTASGSTMPTTISSTTSSHQQRTIQSSNQKILKPSPIYNGSDGKLIQIFKGIGQKRDGTTKSRSLAEFISYVFPIENNGETNNNSNNQVTNVKKSDQIAALSHYFFLFENKLIHDNNSNVRGEAIRILGCAMYHVPKAFRTLLFYQGQQQQQQDNLVGSVGNVIGWVYTSMSSQTMEVARIANDVWVQMKELLSRKDLNQASPMIEDSEEYSSTTFIQKQITLHAEMILQNSSRPSNLDDALSVIGTKRDLNSQKSSGGKGGKDKGKSKGTSTSSSSNGATNNEDTEERYERVVLLTLNGMSHFFSAYSEDIGINSPTSKIESMTFEYANIFTNTNILWKHLSNARTSFRRATYGLIASICQNAPSIIHPSSTSASGKPHNLSSLIPKSLSSEKDPSNFPSMFEMILLFITSFRKLGNHCFAWLPISKEEHNSTNETQSCVGMDATEFTKFLCKVLKRACYGSASSQWGPSMLLLTVSLPTMELQLQTLLALWSGRTAAVSAVDAAYIVAAVSECSTYLLLKSHHQHNTLDENEIEISFEIAQAFLESLRYYLITPLGGTASIASEKNLLSTIVSDFSKLNTLGQTKENCAFVHIREWFWKEGTMNVILNQEQALSEDTMRRLNGLLNGVLHEMNAKNANETSNLLPLLQIIFWTNLQPQDGNYPSFQQISLMICIIKFCGLDPIFADENGNSVVTMDFFCLNTLQSWIIYHVSKTSACSINEIEPYFVMLRMILIASPDRAAIWETVLNNIFNTSIDLNKLALGLNTVVKGIPAKICNDFVCETLDSFSIQVAKNMLQNLRNKELVDTVSDADNKDEELAMSSFLYVCSGVKDNNAVKLVSMDAVNSWIEMCVCKERIDSLLCHIVEEENMLLEILFSCYLSHLYSIKEENFVKLVVTAWYEGSPTWYNRIMEEDLIQAHHSTFNDVIKIASTLVKENLSAFVGTQVKNFDLSCFIWSQRAWKLIEFSKRDNDSSVTDSELVGLNNSVLWKSALDCDITCDFLFVATIELLNKYPDAACRREFFFKEDLSILVLLFMTLVNRCTDCSDHSNMLRCNRMSSLLGEIENFTIEDFKCIIASTISILSDAMSKHAKTEVCTSVALLDWLTAQKRLKHVDTDDINPNEVTKGDILWYIVDGDKKESERIFATIVKVHTDDFPNLYYTIKIGDDTKQTIPSRLKTRPTIEEDKVEEKKILTKFSSWQEESITTSIIQPYIFSTEYYISDAAAECINIVIARCGLLGGTGIGSLRYEIFQLLSRMEKEVDKYLSDYDFVSASRQLKQLSMALGYGVHTSDSTCNVEIIKFDCNRLMSTLLKCYEESNEFRAFIKKAEASEFNFAVMMWLKISAKSSMNETNASQCFALASTILSEATLQKCYQNYDEWFLLFLETIDALQNVISILPEHLKAVTIDSEQSMISMLLEVFVKCSKNSVELSNSVFINSFVNEKPSWYIKFKEFSSSRLLTSSPSILYGAHMQVEGLCKSLMSFEKRICAFHILSSLSNQKNPIYKKDDNLSSLTCKRLDKWLDGVDEEESSEIEEDVITSGMWMPRHLMEALEGFGENNLDESEDDSLLTANLLKWLLCLNFLDSAAAVDMRNRSHIGSYIQLTGAVNYVLRIALDHANVKNHKDPEWMHAISPDSANEVFCLSSLSTLVLFRSAESIPTLFKSWWSDECPRSMQSMINNFVETLVAPETLRRELERIKVASNLDDMSVSGSCVSREIVANYVQDECNLSVMIRVPSSFPLRNVEVDCKKTLGIAEKRWRHWALQIMLMLNSQDGSILDALLLWKQNVDKEFDGVEPCPVCYSVLCVKTHAMPNLECKTCHNRFHSSCLYKWFSSSGKNQCVLCQQPWSGTKVGK